MNSNSGGGVALALESTGRVFEYLSYLHYTVCETKFYHKFHTGILSGTSACPDWENPYL